MAAKGAAGCPDVEKSFLSVRTVHPRFIWCRRESYFMADVTIFSSERLFGFGVRTRKRRNSS
jgi:hypothetical protein